MPDYPINLAKEGPCDLCAPPHSSSKYYPTVYFDGFEKSLPDEGEMTVRFRIARKTEDKKADKTSCDVELLEILSVKSTSKKKSEPDEASDAVDKLRAESGEDY